MAYSAITNGEIDPDSPLTTSLATKFRDNPEAIADDLAGATPVQWSALTGINVDQADLAANSVGQAELITATASQSQSMTSGNYFTFTLTGGDYSLAYFLGDNDSGNPGVSIVAHNGTYTGDVKVVNDEAYTVTAYLYSRYIQASPPYRLDDVVPAFIYALVDNNNGDILGASVAMDPPWAYHGPTNIAAEWRDQDGRSWRREKAWKVAVYQGGQDPYSLMQAGQFSAAMALMQNNSLVPFEITNDIKNRDMGVFPHPFMNQDLTGQTVIMLDPMSSFCIDCMEMILDGFVGIPDLLHKKDIRFSTTPLSRSMPDNVIAVAPRWR